MSERALPPPPPVQPDPSDAPYYDHDENYYKPEPDPYSQNEPTIVSEERRNYQNVPNVDVKDLNMKNPIIRKGFPLSERVGRYCPGLASFFKSEKAYFTHGDTNMTMQQDNEQIFNRVNDLEGLYRNKSVYLKIHDTNGLELDPNVMHPFVRVHFMDISTNMYMKKSGARNVVANSEQVGYLSNNTEYESQTCDYVIPFSTPPFDLRVQGENDPHWDQEFVLDEEMISLLNPNIVILFEILDFNFKLIKEQSNFNRVDGLYPVAWAFMRPAGASKLNFGTSKLQLYRFKYRKGVRDYDISTPEAYYSFNWYRKEYYPSFLRVELYPIDTPILRQVPVSNNVFEKEVPIVTYEDMVRDADLPTERLRQHDDMDAEQLAREKRLTSWRRLKGEACVFPDKLAWKLPSSKLGCFRLAFSNNGKFLAAGCTDDETIIKLFDVEDGQVAYVIRGHADLIHDITWSDDDFHLLSSSSDGTAKLWSLHQIFSEDHVVTGESSGAFNPGTAEFLTANMQHPSYVYCSKFHPEERFPERKFIATACYDGKVRIWYLQMRMDKRMDVSQSSFKIEQEIAEVQCLAEYPIVDPTYNVDLNPDQAPEYRHPNYLDFDNSAWLIIGDSLGQIHVWSVNIHDRDLVHNVERVIKHEELEGDCVNCLQLLPPERQSILVQSRDNVLRQIEQSNRQEPMIYARFFGATVQRYNVRFAISPDGQFLATGSEDGRAYAWDIASGFEVPSLEKWQIGFKHITADISWNRAYNMVAIAGFGEEYPIMIYVYEKSPERITKDLEAFVPKDDKEVLGYQKDPRSELMHEVTNWDQQHRGLPERTSFGQDPGPPQYQGYDARQNQYPSDGQRYPSDGQRYPSDGQRYPSDGQRYPSDGQRQVRFQGEPNIAGYFGGRNY